MVDDAKLPDGLRADVEFGLLTYKSQHESLTSWSIQEAIHHYVAYRKELRENDPKRSWPKLELFQIYALTTLYPQALANNAGSNWQATDKPGVYNLFILDLRIIVIVTSQNVAAPHNRPWNLLSNDRQLIKYAMHQAPLPPDLQQYFNALVT
ncbi:hypothetical protein TI03_05640, partial [Achromatium sp. WMS1]